MTTLSAALDVRHGQAVAVVGCGGKTSLLLRLGKEWQSGRVLLSTTTKIGMYETAGRDYLYTCPEQWEQPSGGPGVHIAGVPFGRKLGPLPEAELNSLRQGFDLTVLECDGSRRLPLKGWREDEPVVPPWVDLTVGIAVVWPIGLPMGEDIAFQPELFCQLTGAEMGCPVTEAHLAAAIAGERGLFHSAVGRRVLILNQVETDADLETARRILARIPAPSLPDLVIAGCLQSGAFTLF